MTWFQSFRSEYGFPFYGEESSPVSLDKPLLAVVYMCVLVSSATLIATLGIRGREKWSHALRASYGVAIASIILVCLVSHDWMEGRVIVSAPFVYRSNMHFTGSLAVRIGLKSANITLDGTYKSPTGEKLVYYEETLPWPNYGSERAYYWSQMERGLPAPILRVMDFLTYDHGNLQWGKNFHTAGQFAWALLWTAFVFWLLSNILLFSVVVYGAYTFFLTGVTLLMACVAFSQTLNGQPLLMSFGQDVLKLEYGWSFWLAVVAGCLTTLLGVLLIVSDIFLHHKVADFFHLEKTEEDDDFACQENFSKSKARFSQDANGKQGFPNGRKGSIFLEPERQTSWAMNPMGIKENPLKVGLLNPQRSMKKGMDGDTKINPLYNGDDDDDDVKLWPQTGGEDNTNGRKNRSMSDGAILQDDRHKRPLSLRVSHDRKPSLATLKEHSENHANERKSNSSPSCSSASSSCSASNKSNFDSNSCSPSTGEESPVRSPTYERFLYDTAQSIRLRSGNGTGGSNCDLPSHPQGTNSSSSDCCTRAVVEAVVEKDPEGESDEGVYSQKAGDDETPSPSTDFDVTYSSLEDGGVFNSSFIGDAPVPNKSVSRQVSETGSRDGVTVVEIVSPDTKKDGSLNNSQGFDSHVSIPMDGL